MINKPLCCFVVLWSLFFSALIMPVNAEEAMTEEYQVRFMLSKPDGEMIEDKQVSTSSYPLLVQNSSPTSDAPVILSGTYWLNDEEKPWDQIAGQAGTLRVELVLVNQHLDESTQEKVPYLVQIQVPIDLRVCSLLEAPLADRVSVGYIQTLSFSGLLQSTMLATWTAYSEQWHQEPINLTLIPKMLDIPIPDFASQISIQLQGLNKMDSGIQQMLEGMLIMEMSIHELNLGFRDYQSGFRQWNLGFQELNSKLPEISQAFDQYLLHMSSFQEGIRQIQVALNEAEGNFKKLQKDMEQTQQALLLLSMTVNQLNTDHQESLNLVTALVDQQISIDLLANELIVAYPQDSPPWTLAKQVLSQSQSQQELLSLIQAQTNKLTLINSFMIEMQKKLKEEYIPLLTESYQAYQELIFGIDQMDEGTQQIIEGLEQGKKGSLEASKGSQELFEAQKPLRQARIEIAEGIRALSQAPRMLVSSLRQLRFQGVLPMSRANKEALDRFLKEKKVLNLKKSIVEKYKNQALVIKIDYSISQDKNENTFFDQPAGQQVNTKNPFHRIKEWFRSLF